MPKVWMFVLVGCFVSAASAQQLYRWVDKDGKVTYADTPPPKDAKNTLQKKFGDTVSPDAIDLPYAVKQAMAKNPVILFASACGELCDDARTLLKTRGIPYSDRNPSADAQALADLKAKSGGAEVPVLMVGTEVLRGFASERWQGALTAAGYPTSNVLPRAITEAKVDANTSSTATPAPATK